MVKNDYEVCETDLDVVEEMGGVYDSSKDFVSLKVWQETQKVKLYSYNEIIPLLPVEERFDLFSQIRRATISITANIAEGYGRYHFQEGIQFYRISRGSLYELKDHLISCFDLKYINKEKYEIGISSIEKSKALLNGYINYIIN